MPIYIYFLKNSCIFLVKIVFETLEFYESAAIKLHMIILLIYMYT